GDGVRELEDAGGLHRYSLRTPWLHSGYFADYLFELDDEGLPWHTKTTIILPDQRPPFSWDQYVLSTTRVAGAELPVDVITTIWNAGVSDQKRGVWHFQVAQAEEQPELTPA